jgi:peptidyl-prolyl cis-trans isomerase D
MLDFVRRHSRSWLVKVALWVIVIVFISWGGYSYTKRHENDVALVGSHYISSGEFTTAYNNMVETYRRQLGGAFSEDLIRKLNLRRQTLEGLIVHYVQIKAADDLGFAATEDEIRNRIVQFPMFQNEGRFEKNRYEAILRENRLTPEEFERQIGNEVTMMKTEAFIKGRAVVTDSEILSDHHFNRDQVKVAYVLFDPKSFEDQVTVDDAALQTFYQANQNKYMEPEKREVAYVFLNFEDLAKDIAVSAEEAKAYYDDNIKQYEHEKEVKARQILFKLKPDASEEEVQKASAEAQKVLDEAKKGKDFGELAKKYSQDEATAKSGGELGYFSAKKVDPAVSEAAFSLKSGEISGLIRTPGGFDILQVEDVREARTEPFDEAKGSIEQNLKLQKAQDVAFKKARDLRDIAYARKDLEKGAQELKLPGPATAWIEMGGDQIDPKVFPQQAKTKLFELAKGEISDMIEGPQGITVAQLKTIKAPQVMPFEQVKDRVAKDYRVEQGRVLAQRKAADVLKTAKDKNSLFDAAKEDNLNVRQSEIFSRQEPDKDLKLLRGESLSMVFDLEDSKPFPATPLELGNRFVVCQLQGKVAASPPSEEETVSISKKLLQQKQSVLWEAWIEDLRKNTKIEIYKEV